jgi:hypothetical protein
LNDPDPQWGRAVSRKEWTTMDSGEWEALEERVKRAVDLIRKLTRELEARAQAAPAKHSPARREKEGKRSEEIRERLSRLLTRLEQLDI